MDTGKSAEYFSHDCNAKDDPKVMLLMAQMGLEAYGIYWILIEYLRQQPGYKAPLVLLDPLSRRYGSSREKFEAVVTKFDLFSVDETGFYSPSLNRRMAPLDNKRERMQHLALMRWNKEGDANVMRTHSAGNAQAMQSKVKESKVKKSKVKKSKVKNIDPPELINNPNETLVKKWFEWVEFRKLLKKPYKTTTGAAAAYNRLLKLAESNSLVAIAIIDQSREHEWLDFYPLKTNINSDPATGEDPVERDLRLTREARKAREAKEAAEKEKVNDMLADLEIEKMIEDGTEK